MGQMITLKKKAFSRIMLMFVLFSGMGLHAQLTAIPDPDFEQYLIDAGYDTVIDGSVPTSAIAGVGHLFIPSNYVIEDMTGIRDFSSLNTLTYTFGYLQSLDVHGMVSLSGLNVRANPLMSINVSGTSLQSFNCMSTLLSSLDVTGLPLYVLRTLGTPDLTCIQVDDPASAMQNTNFTKDPGDQFSSSCLSVHTAIPDVNFEQYLISIGADDQINGLVATASISNITSMDISSLGINNLSGILDFTALTSLNCSNNNLSDLNVGGLAALANLNCSENNLVSLNISATALTTLDCSNNQLSVLTPVTTITALDCSDNVLDNLDVSDITGLATLDCRSNNLGCIEVADVAGAEANTNWLKDLSAVYAVNCHRTQIPDPNFEQALIDFGHDDVIDGSVLTANINTITALDISDRAITNIDGLHAFATLEDLYCGGNAFTSLDVNLPTLKRLYCSGGQLSTLNVHGVAVEVIYCNDNVLTSLSVAALPALKTLDCSGNQLSSIEGSSLNTTVEIVYCSNNQLTAPLNFAHFSGLVEYYCLSNQITQIDISGLNGLSALNCSDNLITEITLNTAIELLACSGNQLTSLNLTNSDSLAFLDCENNPIQCIATDDPVSAQNNESFTVGSAMFYDVTCNTVAIPDAQFESALITLGYDLVQDGKIYSVKVADVLTLDISGSTISDLTGIDSFTSLTSLNCSDNEISSLAFDIVDQLTELDCQNNALTSLDLSDANSLLTLDCTNNPLTCVKVADVTAAEVNSDWNIPENAAYSEDCTPQTLIPDPAFEQALINLGHDTVMNGKVPTQSISGVTFLTLYSQGISDLTGIQDFSSLTYLECSFNTLTAVDVSGLSNLVSLYCGYNQIASLNVSGTALQTLGCEGNAIPALDVSGLPNLNYLNCQYNYIQTLNLSGTQITQLYCNSNQLTELDLTNINTLQTVNCGNNQISALDFSGQPGLTALTADSAGASSLDVTGTGITHLSCSNNNLTALSLTGISTLVQLTCFSNSISSLDLTDQSSLSTLSCGQNEMSSLLLGNKPVLQSVFCDLNNLTAIDFSGCPSLSTLSCSYNGMTTLDLGQSPNVTNLVCSNNMLSELDISGLELAFLLATDNRIYCIVDDNPAESESNQNLNIDDKASFSEICPNTAIPDPNFEQALRTLGYDGVIDGQVQTAAIEGITNLDISGHGISDLTGLQDFTALQHLNAESNAVTTFDYPELINLLTLTVEGNQLSALDVSAHTYLQQFSCSGNLLTTLTLGSLPELQTLNCAGNQLVSVDVSGLPDVDMINVSFNQLVTVDVGSIEALHTLNARNNPLTDVFFGNAISIQSLDVANTTLARLDLRGQGGLISMDATGNVNLSCIAVDNVSMAQNAPGWIKDAETTYNTACEAETLIPDVNFETALIALGHDNYVNGFVPTANISGITTLDVSNLNIADLTGIEDFVSLTELNCSHNSLTSINLDSLVLMEKLNVSYNQLTAVSTWTLASLTHIYAQHNVLTQPYITPNEMLIYADFSYNNIGTGNYTGQNVQYMDLSHNVMSSIWIEIPNATELNISYNYFEEIDLTQNTSLQILDCSYNSLSTLAVTPLASLQSLNCSNNALEKLNLKNKDALVNMDASSNQISCIVVDDVTVAESQALWIKDETVSYALTCAQGPFTLIPDPVFEQALIDLHYDEIIDGQVATASIEYVTELNIPDLGINDLSGIQDFSSLDYLNVAGNNLSTLDLTGIEYLSSVDCSDNQLTSLNVSGLDYLGNLYCSNNMLQVLDVSGAYFLYDLDCSNNQLIAIKFGDNLEGLNCDNNKLTSLVLEEYSDLFLLSCDGNNLHSLDISAADIWYLDCENNPLTCIKVNDVEAAYENEDYYKDVEASYSLDCPDAECPVTVWNGNSWIPNEPDSSTKIVVLADVIVTDDVSACSIEVAENVDVTVMPGSTIYCGDITVMQSATVTLESNAALIQSEGAVTQGIITVKRDVMFRRQDYVYWSSPVTGQNLRDFSPLTLENRFYTLDEASNSFVWADPMNNDFLPAKGYMVRAPNTYLNYPAPQQLFTGSFTGVPNNGTQTLPVTTQGNGYNMMGNPYPSPVYAFDFLAVNPGTLYFWTHQTQEGGGVNYATFNDMGGTAATAGGATPNGIIQTGQGFLLHTEAPGLATFTNEMRTQDWENQFFRSEPNEKHRFWLNLNANGTGSNQILIGYAQGATAGYDSGLDGKLMASATSLSSIILGDDYVIQGRALPFDPADSVPLRLNAAAAGSYSISLDHKDGVFTDGQPIYLKDLLTGVIHDLGTGGYSFVTEAGSFAERFVIIYQNTTLGIESPDQDANSVVVFSRDREVHIHSGNSQMTSVWVFDIRGRLVYEKGGLDSNVTTLENLSVQSQVLLIQISLNNGTVVTKKYAH